MVARPLPDASYLNECLAYDPLSGALTWRVRPRSHFSSDGNHSGWNKQFSGKPALSSLSGTGYLHGALDEKTAKSHRVIWKMMTGVEPDQIDHIDGSKQNNAWANLRNVDYPENGRNLRRACNNTSGHTGVGWSKQKRRWRAYIKSDGKMRCLGLHRTIEAALSARKAAERELGFHVNHGSAAA